MSTSPDFDKIGSAIEGSFGDAPVHFRAARVSEALSTVTEIRIEFLTTDRAFDVESLLGTRMTLKQKTENGTRKFQGTVVAVEFLGTSEKQLYYGVDVRPWLWFLRRSSDMRIFQGKSVPEIVTDLCGEYSVSLLRQRLSESYEAREYCVQYGETDFDFISRLMEEEGIYYYFNHEGDSEEMILADGIGSHDKLKGQGELSFRAFDRNTRVDEPHVFEWSHKGRVVSGKVSLVDYDMTKPNTDLKVSSSVKKGDHSHGEYELYEGDAAYTQGSAGEVLARIRVEREAHAARRHVGAANAADLGVGCTFSLKDALKPADDDSYLVIAATHHLKSAASSEPDTPPFAAGSTPLLRYPHPLGHYACTFEVAPASEPFRPPKVTPAPRVAGVLTALVTGPSGAEIYTDEYGRIKVQFHWDREGKKDENTTCWVRTVVPWSGRGWGMFAIPRIGQEVIIEFERGNPDRPICTGMVYNAVTKPPFEFPTNQTMSGLRTNSSKGGGGFHELIFEDKKDEEYVRMISEKDYFLKIKNNAEITIGLDKKDKGDLTQTIHRHKTETLKTGDYTFKIEKGNRKVEIAKDHTEKIGGNSKLTVQKGNMSTKVKLGKIEEEAMQSIEMKVGESSIKIDQMGVTIKGMMIKINGTAMLEAKAPMSTVKGDAVLILKGGMTMIN
ncbi:type VI secretion system tip protein TssI/VgrG [Pararhodobacter sp. SW119]|uniref:type VI secretion system Vgr family protein n=1 Tax=Pararhodobacter sp. SW119 TaxID=2780075 RepID=UPI001AE0DCCD|nr:type VI secretion system tip protein TssI/VgrG [Pararhodobacter sp. SW119]